MTSSSVRPENIVAPPYYHIVATWIIMPADDLRHSGIVIVRSLDEFVVPTKTPLSRTGRRERHSVGVRLPE